MRKILVAIIATCLVALGGVALAPPASAHTGAVTGKAYCAADGTWYVVWTFTASNVPANGESEVKAMTTSAGRLDKAPGTGVMSGPQVMLNAWREHAGNWPGVPVRTGNWADTFSTVAIPATVPKVTTMVQYDYKGGPSGDPVGEVEQPDCDEPPPVVDLEDDVQPRTTSGLPDCATGTVTTVTEERTRTETAPGVWGPWSDWVVVDTVTRPVTRAECPPKPSRIGESYEDVGKPDCVTNTVTIVRFERERFDAYDPALDAVVTGEWSEWVEVGRIVQTPTEQECPPQPEPEVTSASSTALDCDSRTQTTTTTVTTTPYVRDGNGWALGEPSTTTTVETVDVEPGMCDEEQPPPTDDEPPVDEERPPPSGATPPPAATPPPPARTSGPLPSSLLGSLPMTGRAAIEQIGATGAASWGILVGMAALGVGLAGLVLSGRRRT